MREAFTLTEDTRALWDAWHLPDTPEPTRKAVVSLLENSPVIVDEETRLRLEQLRAALLGAIAEDVRYSKNFEENEAGEEVSPQWLRWLKLALVALAGIVLAVAEGAEIIMDIAGGLGMAAGFSGGLLAGALVLGIGMAVAFCAMDFYDIATALKVRFGRVTHWIDAYVEQTRQIEIIRNRLALPDPAILDSGKDEDNEYRNRLAAMLLERYNSMELVRQTYLERQQSPLIRNVKILVTAVASATMFAAGFAMGMSLISLTMAAPPIGVLIGVGFIFGLLAVAIYLGFRREEAENGVARMCGFDREKVEKICEAPRLKKQQLKILKNQTSSQTLPTPPERADSPVLYDRLTPQQIEERLKILSELQIRHPASSVREVIPVSSVSQAGSPDAFFNSPAPSPKASPKSLNRLTDRAALLQMAL